MSYQDDFALGDELVVGSLTGFRYWTLIRDKALLRGHWGGEWETQEYTAECKAHIDRKLVDVHRAQELEDNGQGDRAEMVVINEITHWKDGRTTEETVRHYYEVILPGGHATPPEDPDLCKCGVYAGYAPLNVRDSWNSSGQLFGVVQATGPTIMGSRGFRTGRAKIVALSLEGLFEQMRESYGDDPFYIESVAADEPIRYGSTQQAVPLDEAMQMERERLLERYPGVELFDTDANLEAAYKPDDLEALGIQNDGGHI